MTPEKRSDRRRTVDAAIASGHVVSPILARTLIDALDEAEAALDRVRALCDAPSMEAGLLDAYERAHDGTCTWCPDQDSPCGWKRTITALREAWAERDALQNWKKGAMGVLSEWEVVWELLGSPGGLGSSKAHASTTAVVDLIARAERAEAALDRVRHECDVQGHFDWCASEDDGVCDCFLAVISAAIDGPQP